MGKIQFKRWSNVAKYHILCIHRSNSLEMVHNLNSLFMWCMYLNCNYELFDSLDTSLGDSIVSFKFLRLHTSNWIFYTKTDLFEWKCCRIPSILVTECSVGILGKMKAIVVRTFGLFERILLLYWEWYFKWAAILWAFICLLLFSTFWILIGGTKTDFKTHKWNKFELSIFHTYQIFLALIESHSTSQSSRHCETNQTIKTEENWIKQ